MAPRLIPPQEIQGADRRRHLRRAVKRIQGPAGVPVRDGGVAQSASYVYARLTRAGDALRSAQRACGITEPPPRVGENLKAQLAVAKHDPGASLRWVESELAYLAAYRDAIIAEQAAGIFRVPRAGSPSGDCEVLAELDRRCTALREIEASLRAPAAAQIAALRDFLD